MYGDIYEKSKSFLDLGVSLDYLVNISYWRKFGIYQNEIIIMVVTQRLLNGRP